MGHHSDGRKRGFPFAAVIVLLSCAVVWLYGAREWMRLQAGYDVYRADTQRIAAVKDVFCEGIRVDGVPLGGLTREEASSRFSQQAEETTRAFTLPVTAGGRQWLITSEEVPITFNAQQVLDRAFQIGHTGTRERRLAEIERASEGVELTTSYVYDREAIDRLVDIVAQNVDREPVNAGLDAFDPAGKTFSYRQEKAGQKLDRDALRADILAALDAERFDVPVQGRLLPAEPEIRLADLQGRFGLISSFTTETTADRDRNTNISISAAALNGRVVQPGQTLSFNGCTGRRTGDKGYREAGAIAGGVLVDDTGGGVCQTSSTLFNAVVRADLEIVKRYAHSWPSSYVPKGEDATVNWPSRDFIFRNSSAYPVFIISWYENRHITVEVYGRLPEEWASIDLSSTTIKTTRPSNDTLYTLDESLPVGTRQAGRSKHTGYLVDTYKVYRDAAGNELRRVKLWTTDYPASQNEILYH